MAKRHSLIQILSVVMVSEAIIVMALFGQPLKKSSGAGVESVSQERVIYKDPKAPLELRVNDLLSRMTPEEKFWQLFMIPGDLNDGKEKYRNGLFGFQISTSGQTRDATGQLLTYTAGNTAVETAEKINAIQRFFLEETRLGIPIIPFDEALHGLVRTGATAFPQSIGLAATFDTSLMRRVSKAIAWECKTRGLRQILSPVVNIAGDVRWGRVEETYGEDPFLSSEMGVAFVSEFEKLGVITTPKHFLANVGDGGRDSYPIHFNERLLREIYLPPFRDCIMKGRSRSVMTSYNSLDGSPATANTWLNNTLLKEEWKFNGFVISDANAVGGANVLHFTANDYADAAVRSMQGGLDVIFQTSYDHYPLFIKAFQDGRIDPKTIDAAVKRVLRAKFALGLFENPYVDPREAARWNGRKEHRQLALDVARKSLVLLKNEKNILPLKKNLQSIAIIGEDAAEARLGGYSGPGNSRITILEGIRNSVNPGTRVLYARGPGRVSIESVTIPSEYLHCTVNDTTRQGLVGEYFNNISLSGKPVFTRLDRQV